MEKIIHKGKLIGVRIKKLLNGSNPITDPKENVQVVTLKHNKGSYLKAHYHKPKKRVTDRLQECMVVKEGKVKLDLFDQDSKYIRKITLNKGDVFILLNGGVGVKMLEDSQIIEIKNGPFKEDKILI